MKFEIPGIPSHSEVTPQAAEPSEATVITDQRRRDLVHSLEAHRAHVRVFNQAGNFLFQGGLTVCVVAWKAGQLGDEKDWGGIADASGKSILRFGPGDEYGFTNRRWIRPLFEALAQGIPQGSENIQNIQQREKPLVQSDLTWQATELGFSGSILAEGKDIGHFSLWRASEGKMYIHDIQIGYDENAPRGKGIGFQIYQKIIERLRLAGLCLVSTDFRVSQTSISPQALRVWEKLESAGLVRRTGVTEGKIHDRFGGQDTVGEIPMYESI